MNKKFRIRLVAVLLALMALVGLSACASMPATAEQDYRIKFVTRSWVHKEGYNQFYDIIYDEETGVEYLIIGNDYITPLYNPDGTLKTKER